MELDILQLDHITGDPDPPQSDHFFPRRQLLQSSLLDVVRLALAIGLAWAIVFLVLSLVALLSGGSALFSLFDLLYPGMLPSSYVSILLGFALSFLFAFIFGLLLGALYNSFVRRLVSDNETFDMFA